MQYEESKLIQKFLNENFSQQISLQDLKQGLEDRNFNVSLNVNTLLVTAYDRYFSIGIDSEYPNSFYIMEIDEDGNNLIPEEEAPLIYRDSEAILLVAQVLKLCSSTRNLILALELAQQRNPRTEKY